MSTRDDISTALTAADGAGALGPGASRDEASALLVVVRPTATEPAFLNRTGSRPEKADVIFIAVPMKLRGEMLGAVCADRLFEDGVALGEDVRVLEIVASIVAHAVRLYWTYRHEVDAAAGLRRELRGRCSLPNIIGDSDAMQEVFRVVAKVAKTNATVLLRGESGTGKELIARALHYQDMNPQEPFIAVNCAALPENLLEAELFGYEKGAFTGAAAPKQGRFELARGGTIFLDEIGDISPALQAKLLRVLQERTFERLGGTRTLTTDARIISATNRYLEDMVARGVPRGPLLAVERRADLPATLAVAPRGPRVADRALPGAVLPFVRSHRQIERRSDAVPDELRVAGQHPGAGEHDPAARRARRGRGDARRRPDAPLLMHDLPDEEDVSGMTLEEEVEALERRRIIAALRQTDHVQAQAARLLGITPRKLAYKMRKYGIDR